MSDGRGVLVAVGTAEGLGLALGTGGVAAGEAVAVTVGTAVAGTVGGAVAGVGGAVGTGVGGGVGAGVGAWTVIVPVIDAWIEQ